MDLSITKVRSILHGINYTGDYHAVVAAGGGERREWWKIIRKVADMHPDTKISDVLCDAFNGSKKVDSEVVRRVRDGLDKHIRNAVVASRAKHQFDDFVVSVSGKLSNPGFLEQVDSNNPDNPVEKDAKGNFVQQRINIKLTSGKVQRVLENMQIIFNALAKLYND